MKFKNEKKLNMFFDGMNKKIIAHTYICEICAQTAKKMKFIAKSYRTVKNEII